MSCASQFLPAPNYHLAATLTSGQVFRFRPQGIGWAGVVGSHCVYLEQTSQGIQALTPGPVPNWAWLEYFLQLDTDLPAVLATFPDDPPMRAAVAACRGLRLLRQDRWECLASFILSSTKQIIQIQQIVAALCERYGEEIPAPPGFGNTFTFPAPDRLASAREDDLRSCKMGFRAPYLLETAQRVASGAIDLESVQSKSLDEARAALMTLPGVGRKVADCALLFGYGFQSAFPLDVWVLKGLRQLYFPRCPVTAARLQLFAATHFGPYAGYAQQYLFHYMRRHNRQPRA